MVLTQERKVFFECMVYGILVGIALLLAVVIVGEMPGKIGDVLEVPAIHFSMFTSFAALLWVLRTNFGSGWKRRLPAGKSPYGHVLYVREFQTHESSGFCAGYFLTNFLVWSIFVTVCIRNT